MTGLDARTIFDRFSELEKRLRQLRERHEFIERAVVGYGGEKAAQVAPEPAASCVVNCFDRIFSLVADMEEFANHTFESIGVPPTEQAKSAKSLPQQLQEPPRGWQ